MSPDDWGNCPEAARNRQDGQIQDGHLPQHPPSDPTLFTGWAHERPMGSIQEEQLLHSLSQLGQDAGGLGAGLRDRRASSQARASDRNPSHLATDLLDDTDVARPWTTLLERHLLEGEKQPHSTGQGPYFYIGGTNGVSM